MQQIKALLSATSEFLLLVRMQPGKWPEGEIGSLGTTVMASSENWVLKAPIASSSKDSNGCHSENGDGGYVMMMM